MFYSYVVCVLLVVYNRDPTYLLTWTHVNQAEYVELMRLLVFLKKIRFWSVYWLFRKTVNFHGFNKSYSKLVKIHTIRNLYFSYGMMFCVNWLTIISVQLFLQIKNN